MKKGPSIFEIVRKINEHSLRSKRWGRGITIRKMQLLRIVIAENKQN